MKKLNALLAILCALALVFTCAGSVKADEAKPVKVGVLLSATTHGWVGGVAYHAETYCKELAAEGKIEYKLLTSSNAEEMTTQFDEMLLWGADAIVVQPQWVGMEVACQNAIDSGVVVVAFDVDIAAEGIYKVTGDNESMGVAGAKYIVDKIGTEGFVVAMPVPTSGSVSELRMKGFMETMKEIAPNIVIKEYANGSFTREEGLRVMDDVLTANPKIDAVFSLDDETSLGSLQAISDAGRTDIKAITGGGGMQDYFVAIKASEVVAASSALYSPLMIKDAIALAISVVNGETAEPIVVIPTQIVDATNVDEFIDPANTIY